MSTRTQLGAGGGTPLLAGAIHGVRCWDLVTDEEFGFERLAAGFNNYLWPLEGPLTACCLDEDRRDDPGHDPPMPDCSCGIYAYHPSEGNVSMEDATVGEAYGVVEAWGRIEVHEAGFRAEHARPVALLIDQGLDRRHRKRLYRAAECHGIEAVLLEGADDLEEYLDGETRGLDPDLVEDLLALAGPVRVRPHATAFVTKRGQAITGFGYMPDNAPQEPAMWKPETEIGVHGARLLRVAGTSYRPAALQDPAFEPGRPLRLLEEKTNLHDRDALAILDEGMRLRVGYVPREFAPEIGRRLRAGRIGAVQSSWQWRDARSGRRTGLHVLISASADVRLLEPRQARRRRRRITASMPDDEIPF